MSHEPSAEFNAAAERVKTLKTQPNNDEMLKLYSLYKQTTCGDCNTDRPGMFDMKGKAKWDAWNGVKGKDQAAADKEYIELVSSLEANYGTK